MMNGGRSKVWIRYPMNRPSAVPMSRTIGITKTGLMWDFSRRLAETIPDRASTEPTDRSMPPEMMTKVMPTARISR